MRRVLITGINGFIGRHLSQFLHGQGMQIVVLEHDRPVKDSLGITTGFSPAALVRSLEGIDAIVH
ncbi:MAG: NAD-dependent epimerase/dehydratase family protein, partial [Gammaproteobacteria bacterium]